MVGDHHHGGDAGGYAGVVPGIGIDGGDAGVVPGIGIAGDVYGVW